MSSTTYTDAAQDMLRAKLKWEEVTKGLSQEERDRLAQESAEILAITPTQEMAVRRVWAEKIFAEFNPYHDHSDGGECGSCGAIQAARFMYPDLGV
jgi:hypothetical protein